MPPCHGSSYRTQQLPYQALDPQGLSSKLTVQVCHEIDFSLISALSLTLSCRWRMFIEKQKKRERNPTIAGESQGEEGFGLTKRPPHRALSFYKLSASVRRGAAKHARTALSQIREGRNVSPRGYPATTAFSSLIPGIGGIDSVIAVAGVHKVKPCSEGTSSLMRNAS